MPAVLCTKSAWMLQTFTLLDVTASVPVFCPTKHSTASHYATCMCDVRADVQHRFMPCSMLVQHVEELRALKGQKRPAVEVDEAILAALPKGKRRRPVDVLAQLEGDDDSGDEDKDADGVLDWRAKAM